MSLCLCSAVLALHENLEPTILIGLPIYTILLVTMSWRAVAQLYLPKVRYDDYNEKVIAHN